MRISFANTKLYQFVVEKNPYIKSEYDNYLRINRSKGKNNRILEWLFLIRVKTAYFILNRRPCIETPQTVKVKTSESEEEKRIAPQYFIKRLLPFDIISFDVFDTLIFRPFSDPKILFDILESENQIEHFAQFRVEAENHVRKEKYDNSGTREVTLNEIYEYIEKYTGLEKEEGMKKEIEKEIDICFANSYMLHVYHMLKSYGKRIIITSDMYLSKGVIGKILERNGYTGYEDIYVSCQYRKSKATGEMYKMISSKLGENLCYIHIGDNRHSDIEMAKEAGWETAYYCNINDMGRKYRADGMSKLIRAASEGIINARLHNGMNIYSPAYEFGYANGGLYCLGYVRWIHDFAVKNDIKKILFLARDGDIYKRIYDRLYSDIASEYVYWSRISTIKYNITTNRYDFIKRIIQYPLLNHSDISFKEILESVDLHVLVDNLENYSIDQNEKLSTENKEVFEKFIIDNISRIEAAYEKEEICAQRYLKSIVGNADKIAVVDIGWAGSGPLGIKRLIEEKWNWKCRVECLIAATGDPGTYKILSDKLHVYMFSKNYNRIHYDFHFRGGKGKVHNDCFEMLTQATHPSFRGFQSVDNDYEMMFATPYVEGYEYIREFHGGILDFAKDYTTAFQNYEMFMNISGYDAYCAIRPTLRNLNYFRHNFGDFPIECNTGKSEHVVKLSQHFEDKGVV